MSQVVASYLMTAERRTIRYRRKEKSKRTSARARSDRDSHLFDAPIATERCSELGFESGRGPVGRTTVQVACSGVFEAGNGGKRRSYKPPKAVVREKSVDETPPAPPCIARIGTALNRLGGWVSPRHVASARQHRTSAAPRWQCVPLPLALTVVGVCPTWLTIEHQSCLDASMQSAELRWGCDLLYVGRNRSGEAQRCHEPSTESRHIVSRCCASATANCARLIVGAKVRCFT